MDEVSLDMVAHDKKRKPVLNLTASDLKVTDNNAPVVLKDFELVKGNGGREHLITMVFDRFDGPTARDAQNVALKILKMLPSDGYSVAVFDLSGRLRLTQPFTKDRAAIAQAIRLLTETRTAQLSTMFSRSVNIVTDKSEPARSKAISEAEKNLLSIVRTGADAQGHAVDAMERARGRVVLNALRESQKVMQDQHARSDLAGLLGLVRAQQQVSERKAIVYFTQNSQMDTAAKELVKTISGAATRAGVSIYAIDMNALDVGTRHQLDNAMMSGGVAFNPAPQPVAGSGGMAASVPMQQASGYGFGQNRFGSAADFMMRDPMLPFTSMKSPLSDLARDSGGQYIDAQNSLKKPLREMLEDFTTYYHVTYVAPLKDYDGSFHAIAITPDRPGVQVHSRAGYYAVPPGEEGGIRPFEVPLLKTLAEVQLPSELKFSATVLRFGELPDGNTNSLAVEVPLSELQVKRDAHTDLYAAHVSIVGQIKDRAGVIIERFGEDLTRRGALESLDRDPAQSISLQRHFITVPGSYTLEVAVCDQYAGKTSAQKSTFEIPNPPSSGSISDLVLVRQLDSPREQDDDPLEPLRYGKARVTPQIAGQVLRNTKDLSLFFILHPDPAAKESPTLEMQVIRNGKPGRRTPLPLQEVGGGAPIPYLANFGHKPLSPGTYEIKAFLNQGGKTSVQGAVFRVEGQPAPPDGTASSASTEPTLAGSSEADMSAPNLQFAGRLSISAQASQVPPLSPDEAQVLIEDARQHALKYNDGLPNFMCIEVTNRSTDPDGKGRWKLQDTILELLRYREKVEDRTTLEVNGKPADMQRGALKGSLSAGEFGGVLKAIFRPAAKADFQWKETDSLDGGTVQVFAYHVDQSNSEFSVTGSNNRTLTVAFHGQVFIDTLTRNVRRVTLVADSLPRDFPTRATSIGVDYDYVSINNHDYLMPISAEMRLLQGRRRAEWNTMEFRDYRRFGSNMKILGFTPVDEK